MAIDGQTDIKVLIGKHVVVIYAAEGQRFKYEGKVLGIDSAQIILDDIKEGVVVLPLQSCQIKAGEIV